jgi:hypothetical protein
MSSTMKDLLRESEGLSPNEQHTRDPKKSKRGILSISGWGITLRMYLRKTANARGRNMGAKNQIFPIFLPPFFCQQFFVF